ncbi:MAG: tRNA (adenosine(37)-N6)-dimethylallyltransferase MiaA [Deltaproteobacteria bacterium]|nr:tRNA (adenosine(37)-N6)-dimethylallyltransferase MiaA [Deltaproteobacteria bacterium]
MSEGKIVVIVGPTGVGKTPFALELAQRINGEIVVADSMQVYRYMDIGTAKPTVEERAKVAHHLIDVVDPDETFSAGRYRVLARNAIVRIWEKGKNAVVCGGTGLYIKSLIRGLIPQSEGNESLRQGFREQEEYHGAGYLYGKLKRVDPVSASHIHPHDTFRTIRALEIYQLTGVPLSLHHARHNFREVGYECLQIGLESERESLYRRIEERCEKMVADGLVGEVRSLLARGYDGELKSMQSLGYRHMCSFINGRATLKEALETMKRDTRRYAKRQITWFRADQSIRWVKDPWKSPAYAEDIVRDFLHDNRGGGILSCN